VAVFGELESMITENSSLFVGTESWKAVADSHLRKSCKALVFPRLEPRQGHLLLSCSSRFVLSVACKNMTFRFSEPGMTSFESVRMQPV